MAGQRRDKKHRVLRRGESVRANGKYQFKYHVNGKRTTQLFNLKNDPWERNDLSGQKKYEKTIQRLREKMAEEQKRTNDTSVFWNNFSY